MEKEKAVTGFVLGLSFLIASCCIAPALFILFGISVSALGIFSALEPYRPIFIGLGAAALVYAAWLIYRRGPSPECETDACAPDDAGPRRVRMLLVGAAVVFLASIAYPYVIKALL